MIIVAISIVENAEDEVYKTVFVPVPLHGSNALTFGLRQEPKAEMSKSG
jgi:hypothetical protein